MHKKNFSLKVSAVAHPEGNQAAVLSFVDNYLTELFWQQFIRPYLCRPLLKKEPVLNIFSPQIQLIIFKKK